MKNEAKALGIRTYTGAFYRYLGTRFFKNRNGVIGAIGFKMPRHAVFIHKGVGRGYPIETVQGGVLGQTRSKNYRIAERQKVIIKLLLMPPYKKTR
ncbi:hypothetical protein QQ054_32210 [Oscillatoria amoena NRMC-F 0135]|nr:hypothetical protein [Oscillatoria amoena NRMC-F 0135]